MTERWAFGCSTHIATFRRRLAPHLVAVSFIPSLDAPGARLAASVVGMRRKVRRKGRACRALGACPAAFRCASFDDIA